MKYSLIINKINALSELTGKLTSVLVIFMVLLISYDVTIRYTSGGGSPALQELEWHLFALVFLLGASYTLKHQEHVRVDLIYHSQRLSDKHRALIDIFGGLFFLIPFCLLIIINAWPFVENSFLISEKSPDPNGLPLRWILKAMIPLGFFLLLLQGIADILDKLFNIVINSETNLKQDDRS